jgi:protein TonB
MSMSHPVLGYEKATTSRFLAVALIAGCNLLPSVSNAQAGGIMPIQDPAILNLNSCRPAYPPGSMRRGEQGVVQLQFTIGVNGRLVGSRIVKSSGFRALDMAALTALIHCTFRPAYRNDMPVQASFTMDYRWALDQ